MKTIIPPGRPIYENRLKYGRFHCQACGCDFIADAGDISYTELYAGGDVVERDSFSHCPNCGKAAMFENGEWEKVRKTESGYDEIYLMLQGWRPCAYHGGRFLHRGEWKPDRWYEFMTKDGTVFEARMKEEVHMDCFYPKSKRKENEVWFYRERG